MSESAPACLAVINRHINLKGVCAAYILNTGNGSVEIDREETQHIIVKVDELPDLINELTAIMRHIPELGKGNEMW